MSFLEKSPNTRHFTFSSYNGEGVKFVPTAQVNAYISDTTVTETPLQVRTSLDVYQEKVSILDIHLKTTAGNASSLNEAFHTTSGFSNALSQFSEANCKRATSQVLVVSSGANTGKCYQYNLCQKSSAIMKNPRCFSEELTEKIMEERINCPALKRKHNLLYREDEVSLSSCSPVKHRFLTEQETEVESTERNFP